MITEILTEIKKVIAFARIHSVFGAVLAFLLLVPLFPQQGHMHRASALPLTHQQMNVFRLTTLNERIFLIQAKQEHLIYMNM